MSVKVAVRVRPFNPREKELGCTLCVNMTGNMTQLTNPEDEKTRDFTFDYSFWSHDGFENDENGYSIAVDPKYATQMDVFNQVGVEVLNNAWEGYHCCLFAYGQTGAGKSYSMVGYGANKGIVPISMQQIFERIAQNTNPDVSFEVCFSMLEIYNEKIQDLLIPVKDRPSEGLKVREHVKYGVYVDGLSKHPVDSYEVIEGKMEEGSKNRTIGSTMMNASSSRAHTIMAIEFKKIEIIDKKKTERFSVINLVDLAGSEKIAKTGATGDRLKEGCSINKSLSTLGLVISKLADKSMGKKNVVVPYRDSALTRILQNALGGNSKTLMICAISPANDNYDETLSTLRYADQAKKIKNNAVINESEQDKMIRELKEENEKLKEMLKNYKPGEGAIEGPKAGADEETLKRLQEMEEQLRSNALMMQEYEKSFQDKLAEAKEKDKHAHEAEVQIDKTKPYCTNLNEDPLLSGKVLHSLAKEKILIGKKNGDPLPDIILGGIGIKANHAQICNDGEKVTIAPTDAEAGEQLFVNGNKILEERELFHNDRILIGTSSLFVFKYPGKEELGPNTKVKDEEIDWEYAQSELINTMDQEKKIKMAENEKQREVEVQEKINEIEAKYQQEKLANEDLINKQKLEFEAKLKELEGKMMQESEQVKLDNERKEAEKEWKEQFAKYEAEKLFKERERERMQKEVQEEATLKRFKEQERMQLEYKIAKHLSQITEVNLIAKELNRDIVFSIKLAYNFISGVELQLFGQEKAARTKIQVMVNNKEVKAQYIWSMSKFTNRYFIIKDLLEQHYEGTPLPPKNTNEDPFWDPAEAHVVGQCFLCLESLGYLLDNPVELTLVSDSGPVGKLNVNVYPTDEFGKPLGESADLIDDPNELEGRRLDFAVQITSADLPENICQDTYCQYAMLMQDGSVQIYKTIVYKGTSSKPEFNYVYHHTFENVDAKILNYILNHNLKLQLLGYDYVKEKKAADASPTKNQSASSSQSPTKNAWKKKLQISAGDDNETKQAEKDAVFNDNNEDRYRQTVFAPGAAVNVKQSMTPNHFSSGFAVNPSRVQNQTYTPQHTVNKGIKFPAGKEEKEVKGKDGKDKDCNIF